jgi:hypothetical protein
VPFHIVLSPVVNRSFAVDQERFGDDVFYTEAGVEGGEGVLKDDLEIATEAAHFAWAGREKISAVEVNAA